MPFVIRSLLKSLLVVAIFVPVATCLPFAALSLCRTPDGATAVFWLGPWSCCSSTLSSPPSRGVKERTLFISGAKHTAVCCTRASSQRVGCSALCSFPTPPSFC